MTATAPTRRNAATAAVAAGACRQPQPVRRDRTGSVGRAVAQGPGVMPAHQRMPALPQPPRSRTTSRGAARTRTVPHPRCAVTNGAARSATHTAKVRRVGAALELRQLCPPLVHTAVPPSGAGSQGDGDPGKAGVKDCGDLHPGRLWVPGAELPHTAVGTPWHVQGRRCPSPTAACIAERHQGKSCRGDGDCLHPETCCQHRCIPECRTEAAGECRGWGRSHAVPRCLLSCCPSEGQGRRVWSGAGWAPRTDGGDRCIPVPVVIPGPTCNNKPAASQGPLRPHQPGRRA